MKRVLISVLAIASVSVSAEQMHSGDKSQHDHDMMIKHHGSQEQIEAVTDSRELVRFPEAEYHLTLQNMRDHLRGLNVALSDVSQGKYEQAADAIETYLGFGNRHGANGMHSAREYMPAGMQSLGHGMHMKANQLAANLRDAAITEDSAEIFSKMAELTAQCVACHDSYRLAPE